MSDSECDSEIYPPWNFSWVVDNELAAMAWPQNDAHLRFLTHQGIGHLVTLSPEKLPPAVGFPGLDWTFIPIKEFEAPSVKEIIKFIDVCQRSILKHQAVGVHCRMGRGRTGVMAACYLVRFKGQAPERAIINVRIMRPGSVETPQQERAVIRYHDCLRGTKLNEVQSIQDDTDKYKLI